MTAGELGEFERIRRFFAPLAGPGGLDGVILTDTEAPQARFDELLTVGAAHGFVPGAIVAPSLLGVSAMPASTEAADVAAAGVGR